MTIEDYQNILKQFADIGRSIEKLLESEGEKPSYPRVSEITSKSKHINKPQVVTVIDYNGKSTKYDSIREASRRLSVNYSTIAYGLAKHNPYVFKGLAFYKGNPETMMRLPQKGASNG